MANPTPAYYLFRVLQVKPVAGNASLPTPNAIGYYVPQFSADSGTSWNAVFSIPFQSLTEATQAIVKIVQNEDSFRTKVQAGTFVPVTSIVAYP